MPQHSAPETLRIVQTVHDTVRDTVTAKVTADPSILPAVAQLVLGIVGILATVVFGLPAFVRWIENRRPPKVTIRIDLGAEEMVAPDRHNSWGRSTTKRYAVVRVENRRGIPFPITGGRLDSPAAQHPVWFQATNVPRVLEPREATHYHFEMEQVGDPAKATFTLMSHGWEKTYRFDGRGSA